MYLLINFVKVFFICFEEFQIYEIIRFSVRKKFVFKYIEESYVFNFYLESYIVYFNFKGFEEFCRKFFFYI